MSRVLPSPPEIPASAAADLTTVEGLRAACAFCGLRPAFVAALEADLPALRDEPWRDLLAELHRRVFLTREMDGETLAARLAARQSSAPPLFPVFLFLTGLASARADHAARGVPEAVSRATFSDLDLWMENHRARHGAPGLGEIAWLHNHFTGRLLALSRLQYRFETVPPDLAPIDLAPPSHAPVLSIHIPAAGPLTPEACDRSLAAAAVFFPRHYSDRPVRALVCYSWLLDPALGDYLPRDSNIVRFRRRFAVFPLARQDDAPFRALFPDAWTDPVSCRPRTALQAALRDRLLAGRRWAVHGGVLREHFFPT